jgi:hypothetical protein
LYTANMRRFLAVLVAAVAPLVAETISVPMDEATAAAVASEVYVYGYPLVTMEMTRRVATNVEQPSGLRAPMGQFAHLRNYPKGGQGDMPAPNTDVLYSTAWIDLSKGAYVLHIPEMGDRYYLMPMVSGWGNVFFSPGSRTTGNWAQDYLIVGPRWAGTPPAGVQLVRAPTDLVWLVGRIYSSGAPGDVAQVQLLQDRLSLQPLSGVAPGEPRVDLDIDMFTPVRDQVKQLDSVAYFNLLAHLLVNNPPAPEDGAMVVKIAQIGLMPGHCYSLGDLTSCIGIGVVQAAKLGQTAILNQARQCGGLINGWTIELKTGRYGRNYLQRAAIAAMGLGASLPQDAIYPIARVDSEGNALRGDRAYTITFPKCETPPVQGYWSLTLYDDKFALVPNGINRNAISPRNALRYAPDGSLTLYIQQDSPGQELESNWLPSPCGEFFLMLRLYWPDDSVLRGCWTPPPVERVLPPLKPEEMISQ